MSLSSLEVVGVVEKIYGNNNYLVTAEVNGKTIELKCHMSGRMLKHRISVLNGDQVTVEVPPPFDKGRITFRGVKKPREEQDGGKQSRTKERKRAKGKGARRR